jgi:hypothetical protein
MSEDTSNRTPETEVIACPACKHVVRVPLDWLGTQVQCPECKALFRAPVRGADGTLGPAELLPSGASEPAERPVRRRPDLMLLLPAFGLMLCGVAGALVNAGLLFFLLSDPVWGKNWAKGQVEAVRKFGGAPAEDTPDKQAAKDDAEAESLLRQFRVILPVSLLVSAVVGAGGAGIVFRRGYRFAQVACVLAAVNVAHCCCVPGALFGLWGLLMLGSEEGREHFLR